MPRDPRSHAHLSIVPPPQLLRRRAGSLVSRLRLDLGLRSLLPEWRAMLSPQHLREDVVAGLTVACIALPLSLAIALASDVPPALGLTTAIVAGITCAFFAGQRLGVSGPAAAMAVLVGQIVDAHGLAGLIMVGVGCGLLQIVTGVLGLGRLMRLVPRSVVHGFTAGIGVIILIGQLPRALGLPAPDETHALEVAGHIVEYLTHADWRAIAIALPVVLAMVAIPRKWPKIPTALFAVAIPALVVWATGAEVALLGEIPRGLPAPTLPAWPDLDVGTLAGHIVVVYALASLESLLSASALDAMQKGHVTPHDGDQELIGQGLGNLASAAFGGIPVTGVIARSSLNLQAGARTRRSAVIHALALIAFVYLLPDVVSRLPIAALAGVLLATGIRMLDLSYLRELWHASRTEALVFVITVVVMVAFDLVVGVQAGLVAALVVAVLRLSRATGDLHPARDPGAPHHLTLSGPLTFLASSRLDTLRAELMGLRSDRGLVLDLRHVDSIDASAAGSLIELVSAWRARGAKVALLGPNRELEHRLLGLGEGKGLEETIAHVEDDLDKVLATRKDASPGSAHRRLTRGVERFRDEVRGRLSPLFDRLAAGQTPHTLFLTCADSRVSPALITGSQPGELFVVRNIGALLPPHGHATLNDEGAALEYAVRVLGVRNVVVCGHSKCGAMTALREGLGGLGDLHALAQWAKGASALAGDLRAFETVDLATQACSVRQLEHLKSYPVVADALARGELQIQAWFFDVETADVLEHDAESDRYVPVGGSQELDAVEAGAEPALRASSME